MCIAIPMTVESVDGYNAIVFRGRRREEVDIGLIGDVAPGEFLLVFRGVALRKVDADEAARVTEAISAVSDAMEDGVAPAYTDAAFADIIENTGKLPPHLQKLVPQRGKS